MKLKSSGIAGRLALAFGVVLALLCLMTGLALNSLAQLQAGTERLAKVEFVNTKHATAALDNARGSIARVFQLAVDKDPKQAAVANDRLKINIKAYDAALAELRQRIDDAEGKALVAKASTAGAKYSQLAGQAYALIESGKEAQGRDLAFGPAYESMHAFANELRAVLEFSQKRADAAAEQGAATYVTARNILIGMGAAAILLGVMFAWWVTKSITMPIAQAVRVAETVAGGDLSVTIDVSRTDEAGQLLTALKAMNQSLAKVVAQVRSSSESIATGSSQIANGNADLSQRTEEQASSLQQTAASMGQLTTTVRGNADNANQARDLAGAARAVADEGGAAVGQVVATMEAISDASRKIADIIGVIDGIAFQTNILALNAAVEAARAGEQGRGFAVVASEVRGLAQRSGDAAREIRSLITDSVRKVEAGTEQVAAAGRTMSRVVEQVGRVDELIGRISVSTGEQTEGIGQISLAVNQLDQVTQQNAALVEESAAAAESLNVQAQRLVQAVGAFKLADEREPAFA